MDDIYARPLLNHTSLVFFSFVFLHYSLADTCSDRSALFHLRNGPASQPAPTSPAGECLGSQFQSRLLPTGQTHNDYTKESSITEYKNEDKRKKRTTGGAALSHYLPQLMHQAGRERPWRRLSATCRFDFCPFLESNWGYMHQFERFAWL
jgi:hypothetical protein